jgi:predicted phage terminase large subunit-like protein
MRHYAAVVHQEHEVIDGRPMATLWPAHKPLAEVLQLRDTTPPLVWEGMYQGNPTPAGGYTFRREWWSGKNRYPAGDPQWRGQVIARYDSWDTAEESGEGNAYSVKITGEILRDYRLIIRDVYRERLTFDVLPATIESQARRFRADGKLKQIIIEDKSSGKSARQTLQATSPAWLRPLIVAYSPVGSKEARAGAASVWCANGMVLLPYPGEGAEWLMDFEDELFSFPQSTWKDQVDAFAQLILYLENYLAEGYRARAGVRL